MAGLATRVDPEKLISKIHASHRATHINNVESQATPYSSRYSAQVNLSSYKIPQKGAPGDAVAQLIRDELDLDGRAQLNLASFVGTYMDEEARKLYFENVAKNLSDADEYPAMTRIVQRCVSQLAHLWHGDKSDDPVGTATTGSSEAIFLGTLAMKRRWQERRMAEGKDTHSPNIILASNAQVALEKAARYLDIESRMLPVSKKSQYRLDPALIKENLDENTIGIFCILGSTYTGHYEPVKEVHDILDEFEASTGISIPIHVDAASGGFIAPFTHAGAGALWDFKLPRVCSINTSGHKFGLVYAGIGWIVFRDKAALPQHLIFELHYLGGTEESYGINFSRPGSQAICQYYNLIHLGFEGYRAIMENALSNARLLSKVLEATGWYRCISDIHRSKGVYEYDGNIAPTKDGETSADYNPGLPVVAFTLSDDFKKKFPHVHQVTVSNLLRSKEYIVPNYPLPPNEDKTEILRVVVRESMSLDMLDRLISDIVEVTETIMNSDETDLSAWQPSTESKNHTSIGLPAHQKHKAKRPMHEGVHRTVC